jgi:signal recognition particle subunit SRP54
MASGKFSLTDFRDQMKTIRKMGPMKEMMKMIPGMGAMMDSNPDIDAEDDMTRIEAIINSMTPNERENPDQVDHGRRNRIAQGSGTNPSDINKLIKEFKQMSGMMKEMANMGMRDKMKAMKEMTSSAAMNPNANMKREKQRSKRGPQDKSTLSAKKKQERQAKKKQRKNKRKR